MLKINRYTGSNRSQSRPSTSSRAISAVGERIRKSAVRQIDDLIINNCQGSLGSRSSGDHDRRNAQLRSLLDVNEKKLNDAESRVHQLEREVIQGFKSI